MQVDTYEGQVLSNTSLFLPRCMECRRGLAMRFLSVRLSVRLSVCPSVPPSVKRVFCDKTEEKSVQIFYTVRKIILSSEGRGVAPQSIPEFPLRHSSKFNKIKIHTHTHTLFFYTLCLLYFYTLYFYKVIILALIL